jgi:hypothetical protein
VRLFGVCGKAVVVSIAGPGSRLESFATFLHFMKRCFLDEIPHPPPQRPGKGMVDCLDELCLSSFESGTTDGAGDAAEIGRLVGLNSALGAQG